MDWLATGVTAGLDMLGSAFGNAVWRDQMGRARSSTERLTAWNLLNGPSLMQQGYEDAGINPLLAIGASPTPIATHSIPSYSPSSMGSRAVEAGINSAKAESQKERNDAEIKDIENRLALGEVKTNIDNTISDTETKESQADLNKALADKAKVQTYTDIAESIGHTGASSYFTYRLFKDLFGKSHGNVGKKLNDTVDLIKEPSTGSKIGKGVKNIGSKLLGSPFGIPMMLMSLGYGGYKLNSSKAAKKFFDKLDAGNFNYWNYSHGHGAR